MNIIFLFPEIWRPLKANFAARFERLSKACSGYIFTLSSDRYRNHPIGHFHLFSERMGSHFAVRFLKGVWIRIAFPIRLLWRRRQIDAIVAYDPYVSGFAGVMLKFFLRAKLIVEINGDYHQLEPSSHVLKNWLMRLIFHTSVSWADAIKVVNKNQEEFINQHYPGKRVYRFPNLVATEFFRSLEHYPGDYLLTVGTEFERKGVDLLIRAFRQISDNHPNMKLKIMGYCPENEIGKYKELANGNSRIEFIKAGWIEDVGEQMRGCYAFVNAARSDAAPRVIREAMACKKTVVATRTNGAVDYIDDGRTGLLCELENVDDLAKKLDWLISKPTLAAQMGQEAFERLQKEFSEEKYTEAFLALLNEVVQEQTNIDRGFGV
jgi:glycosyltransferase involved in cell wall biosynthesis